MSKNVPIDQKLENILKKLFCHFVLTICSEKVILFFFAFSPKFALKYVDAKNVFRVSVLLLTEMMLVIIIEKF